ncbi:hypothetical protein Hte_006713 [Hypoxylon texense]
MTPSPPGKGLLGEKAVSTPTQSSHIRRRMVERMPSPRHLFLTLLLGLLVTAGLANAVLKQQPSLYDDDDDSAGSDADHGHDVVHHDDSTFSRLLSSASPQALHEFLHAYFPSTYKHGIYDSDHSAMEAVHATDPELATSIVQMAKRQQLWRLDQHEYFGPDDNYDPRDIHNLGYDYDVAGVTFRDVNGCRHIHSYLNEFCRLANYAANLRLNHINECFRYVRRFFNWDILRTCYHRISYHCILLYFDPYHPHNFLIFLWVIFQGLDFGDYDYTQLYFESNKNIHVHIYTPRGRQVVTPGAPEQASTTSGSSGSLQTGLAPPAARKPVIELVIGAVVGGALLV